MATHGRSISSTIMDFFRTPLDGRHYEGKEGDDKELLGLQCGTEIEVEDHGSGIDDGSERAIPAELGTMILLRDEEQEKPPIVSILPVERLKLLRQKQEWRRITEGMMLKLPREVQVPDAMLSSQYVAELPDTSDSRFSFKQSDTPSPLKQDARNKREDAQHLPLRISKYKKISERERRGTKWSGDLEYDLAEYDNFPKQDSNKAVGSKTSNIGIRNSTKIKDSGLPRLIDESTRGRGLSDTQRNILLKGPDSFLGKKTEPPAEVGSAKQGVSTTFTPLLSDNLSNVDENKMKNNVILPSFGFDFVKGEENSLEGVSAPRAENPTTIPLSKSGAPSTIKSMSGVSKIRVPTVPAEGEAGRNDKLPIPNLIKATHSSNDNEGDEPRRKRKVPGGTTNEQKGGAFSFVKHSQEVDSSKSSFPVQEPQGNVKQKSFRLFNSTNNINQKRPLEVEENLKVTTPGLDNSIVEKSKPKLDFSFKNTEPGNETKIASLPDGNGTSNKKPDEKQSFTFFNKKSTESGSTNTGAFSFGKAKVDSTVKPSFSFGSVTEAGKPDEKSPKPSFNFESKDDGKSSPKPVLPFGIGKDSTSDIKPSFSFGSNSTANATAPKPSFTFSSKDSNGTSSKPSFEFGTKATPPISLENGKNDKATPALAFGAASNKGSTAKSSFFPTELNTTEGTASNSGLILSKPGEADGNVEGQSSSNEATSRGLEALSDNSSAVKEPKTVFNFSSAAQTNSNSEKPKSGGFTFSRKADGNGPSSAAVPGVNLQIENKSKPNFSFGTGNIALNGGLNGPNEPQASAPAPAPAPSAFSFNRTGLPTNKSTPGGFTSSAALKTGTTTTGGQSSFNFKMNPDTTKGPALNPTNSSGNTSANPFIGGMSNSGGFAFGQPSGNPIPNSNGPTLFGSTQAIKPIGNSTTPSPAFGQSATPPAVVSNTSSRAFTPSSTINLNFGNSATVNPSTIFSGAPQQPAGIMSNGTPPPQQIFGATPPPSSHPFGSTLQQPNLAFNSTQPSFGNNQNENVQAPTTNFQLPQGRKLARMRQSRRG